MFFMSFMQKGKGTALNQFTQGFGSRARTTGWLMI
jgi:hypothetical protein